MIKRLLDEVHELLETAKRKIGSLNFALMMTLVLGIAIAAVSYFAIDIVSRVVIEGVYMQEDKRKERSDEYAARLQDYVMQNGVTAKDTAAFTAFMQENEYVYLMVYSDEELVFGSAENAEHYDEEKDMYVITTADGERLGVVINDVSETFYYTLFNVIKLVGAVVALFSVMIVYVQRLTARISKLSREVGLVSGGDTGRHVNMPGHDEITELSRSVDQMRVSILTKIESERAALEANSELIKSMSHDIRTPLTVLLGYIDMMKERAAEDPMMMEYVLASEKTAMRLKRLSDDLFGYFLLFGKGAGDVNLAPYNFGFLAEQMLAEFMFVLSEKEYVVNLETASEAREVDISTDPDMLMRIIENLLSNMCKYADKSAPIIIKVTVEDGFGKLTFTNTVYRGDNKVETNGIGLKSCRKIAETLGLGFEFHEEGDVYTSVISLPIAQKTETEE